MRELPPLDAHAHVDLDIAGTELERLGAVVLVATRSVPEYQQVLERTDAVTVWGVGCHPSLVKVQKSFDVEEFHAALARAPIVSEIGLDGASRVDLDLQTRNFRSVVQLLATSPRIASIHSYRAAAETLALLEEFPGTPGRVLHWWLGDEALTERAVGLGCYFSLNFSMVRSMEDWRRLPLERLLVETDHPHGDRFSPRPRQPGLVQPVEAAIAAAHDLTPAQVRARVWSNFRALVTDTNSLDLLPSVVQRMLGAVQD